MYKKTPTRFSKHIRIDPRLYRWIETHKDTRTNAAFLEKIISYYKKHYDQKRHLPEGE